MSWMSVSRWQHVDDAAVDSGVYRMEAQGSQVVAIRTGALAYAVPHVCRCLVCSARARTAWDIVGSLQQRAHLTV
jgi:hypothetical protein